jgi:glutathione synthase
MRIGLVCNDIATEEAHYTTTHLGMSALEMGHEAWLIGVGDFASDPDDCVRAWARAAPRNAYRSPKTYLTDVQGDKAKVKRITIDELDVLLLRNDPAADLGRRPWAQTAGIIFGQHAVSRRPRSAAGSLRRSSTSSSSMVIRLTLALSPWTSAR